MVNLELVLDFLADNGIRATYGAVGAATGIHERSLRHEHQFRDLDPRTAWVVYANTRQPPTFHARRPDDSELIRNGDELAYRVSAPPKKTQDQPASTVAADDEKTQDQPASAVATDDERAAGCGCLVALTVFAVIALAFLQ